MFIFQIGLTDILFELGVQPDNVIGHSFGELGCSYAEGSMTAEQMILCVWSRAAVSIESTVIHGSMASIGMTVEDLKPILPSEIDLACHNSLNNCTISGPSAIVQDFIKKLEVSIFNIM